MSSISTVLNNLGYSKSGKPYTQIYNNLNHSTADDKTDLKDALIRRLIMSRSSIETAVIRNMLSQLG